jgi:hypothetical protein
MLSELICVQLFANCEDKRELGCGELQAASQQK